MSSIKFVTSRSKVGIEEVEIERETEHSVWIKGNRLGKHSDWQQHHETYEQAFNFLDCKYSQRLQTAESRLDTAKNEYKAVQKLSIKEG